MIGSLRGQIALKRAPDLLIEVGGVGYELQAPMSTFYNLPEQGATVTLYTHLIVREDAQSLYGFAHEAERSLFRALLKVNGVGAKIALAVLSGMDVKRFTRCIEAEDATALTRIPGIGRKTAERLIVEMRDRLANLGEREFTASHPAGETTSSPAEEAAQALIALGYKPQEASRMIERIAAPEHSSEQLIRLALQASLK
jgi:holliday junction DNA helicase RuvA